MERHPERDSDPEVVILTAIPTVGPLAEFQRSWKIVLVAGVGLACGLSAVPIYSLGVFTKPLSEAHGWSRYEVQTMYTWMTLGNLVAAPFLGWLIDRQGVRRVTLVSLVGMALGMASLGLLTGPLWSFYVLAFVTAILGIGTVPITWTRLIIDWFNTGRGRALGIALAGTGVSATFIPIYTTWLMTEYGWRMAYVGLAALPALIALPLSYVFLFDRTGHSAKPVDSPFPEPLQKEPMEGMEFRDVIRGYRFWTLNAAFMMVGLCIAGIIAHLIPMLTDQDVPVTTAAQVAGTIGIAVVIGRIGTGYLIDRFWAPGVGMVLLCLPAVSCMILAAGVGGVPGALLAAVLVGLAAGAEFDLMSFLTSKYFGQRKYGIIYSWLYAGFKLSAGIGAPLFGLSFDLTGSYSFMLYCAAGSLIGGSLLMLILGPYRVTAKA